MSLMYPAQGSGPVRRCLRCGMPLAPTVSQCSHCGFYTAPDQVNNSSNWTSSQTLAVPAEGEAAPLNAGVGSSSFLGSHWSQQTSQPAYPPIATPENQSADAHRMYSPPPPQHSYSLPNPSAVPGGPPPIAQPGSFQAGYDTRGQVREGGGKRIGILVATFLLVLLVLGGGIFSYVLLTRANNVATTQSHPTPIPVFKPAGQPLFSDTFQDNSKHWDLTSSTGVFSVKVGSGNLMLEEDNNKLIWELLPGARSFSNFYLTFDASLTKGTQDNGYGVYIRGSSNQLSDFATFYRFELYGDGTYAVFKGAVDANGNSKSSVLVDYTTSSVIQKSGHVNYIAINANGSVMKFFVNGQLLQTVTDNSYPTGLVGLFVSNLPSTSAGAQVSFSHFAIYPPQKV